MANVRIATPAMGLPGRGELQMKFDGGSWGGVCDDVFQANDNAVLAVCTQLGYDCTSGACSQYDVDSGNNNFAADNIACPYQSTSLTQCTMNTPCKFYIEFVHCSAYVYVYMAVCSTLL
jgi:hypothetical protein